MRRVEQMTRRDVSQEARLLSLPRPADDFHHVHLRPCV